MEIDPPITICAECRYCDIYHNGYRLADGMMEYTLDDMDYKCSRFMRTRTVSPLDGRRTALPMPCIQVNTGYCVFWRPKEE